MPFGLIASLMTVAGLALTAYGDAKPICRVTGLAASSLSMDGLSFAKLSGAIDRLHATHSGH